jgi:hypothetical protein
MHTVLRILGMTIVAAAGCGGSDVDSADGDRVPHWPLELLTRIGSLDDPELGLTQVTRVAFGPDSLLYIAQTREHEVRVYRLDGTLVRRMGREGEGPGEFREIAAIGFLDDTLYVTDATLNRVSTFDDQGNPIASFPWSSTAERGSGPVFPRPTPPEVILGDGSGLLHEGYFWLPGQAERADVPFLRIHRESAAQDTIAWLEVELPVADATFTDQGREWPVRRPIDDHDLPALMDDGSGVIVLERPLPTSADPHAFRIVKLSPRGDTLLAREYPYVPVPTPTGEAERLVDQLLAGYPSFMEAPPRAGLARIYASPGFVPPYQTPVRSIEAGRDGTLWLERERADPDSTTWNAIGPTGDLAGEIRLAEGADVMDAAGNLLAVRELDEFDVPYVLVYRIVRED